MSDTTYINDPTASQGAFRLNKSGEGGGLEMPLAPGAGGALPGTRALIGQLEKEEQGAEKEQAQYEKDRSREYEQLHRLQAQRPAIPQQKLVGPAPDANEYNKRARAWGGAMAMIGALAAKGARASGTQAMAAFNGALKGWQEGNLEAYMNSYEKWKNESERTIQNNRQMLERYRLVLEDNRMNIDQQMAAIQQVAVEHHDATAFRLAKERNFTAIAGLYDRLDEYTNGEKGLDRATKQLAMGHEKIVAGLRDLADKWGPYAGDLDNQRNDDGTPLSTGQKLQIRYALENYGPAATGLAGLKPGSPAALVEQENRERVARGEPRMSTQETLDFLQKANVQLHPARSAPGIATQRFIASHPEATPEQVTQFSATYNAAQARARTLGVRGGNVDTSADEASRASRLALAASDEVPRGKWVPINVWKQKGLRAASNPEMKNFDLKNTSLITAYSQTMSKTGVNSVEAQKRAESVLNTSDGPEAYRAGVEALLQEMDTVRQAVRDVEAESGIGTAGQASTPSGASPTSGTTFREGDTATGPGGKKATFRGGQWVMD